MVQDLINTLNPMQKQAVLKTEGPLLLLAGAGSGKTRVLTHRIAYLIDKGINPFNILAITFTNKAAKEMKERVESICENGNLVWVSTFHSTCVRILRKNIHHIGFSNNFTIYDSDDSEKLIKEICKTINLNEKNFPPKMVLSEIGKQKDELITAQSFSKKTLGDYRLSKIAEIYTLYEKKLKQNNALDFDDLILKTVQLFVALPQILEQYQDRFRYIMVDEYQDTNSAQYNLIRLLSDKYKNLCVVGDDDQSIYGWRGANIRNILDFEKDFKDAQTIKLEQNYRSTKLILNSANAVIKNNLGRKSKQLWTENNNGNNIKFFQANSDLDESKFIADEIIKKVKKGSNYNDFAILYRNNSLSRIIEERFVKESIPYRLLGGVSFYGRKEVKDILSYLKILFNESDDICLKRIINVPKRGIGDTTVDRLSAYTTEYGVSLFSAISNVKEIEEIKPKTAIKLSDFRELINYFKLKSTEIKVSELINEIINKTGYLLELQTEGTDEALARIENIQELINKAVEFENISQDISLESFLSNVALVADIDNLKENVDAVVLMTLHSSKGLEFPCVFIAGFEENIFPSYRSLIDLSPNALEEERRLCYVGITRAKQNLYLTCAKERLQHGNSNSNSSSRFLKEIPSQYIEMDIMSSFNRNINTSSSIKTTHILPNEKTPFNSKPKYNGYGINNYKTNNLSSLKDVQLDYNIGDKIRAARYGIGEVKEIEQKGNDYEITVTFEDIGEKKFMAQLAKLKKIN